MWIEVVRYLPRWFSFSCDDDVDEIVVVYLSDQSGICVDQLLVQVNGEVRC